MKGIFNENTYDGIKRKVIEKIGEPECSTGMNFMDCWTMGDYNITLTGPRTSRETRSKIMLFYKGKKVLVASFQNGLDDKIINRGVNKVFGRIYAGFYE